MDIVGDMATDAVGSLFEGDGQETNGGVQDGKEWENRWIIKMYRFAFAAYTVASFPSEPW